MNNTKPELRYLAVRKLQKENNSKSTQQQAGRWRGGLNAVDQVHHQSKSGFN